jgi:hypothetical protein
MVAPSVTPELDEDERISWKLASCCLTDKQMAVISLTAEQEKLSLWDVLDPLRVTHLKSQFSNIGLKLGFGFSMKMDEEFICISVVHENTARFYFFSKETLDLHWQKTLDGYVVDNLTYGKGLLLLYVAMLNEKSEEYGVIQVYDVTSRNCFREISIRAKDSFEEFRHNIGFNSKFMVVTERSENEHPYEMNIYDLEAIKNPKSTVDELLFHFVAVDFIVDRIVVTETEIFCENGDNIRRLDFGSFECFRNEAKSVTLSLPWRDVWRSKGVDEEPLEPARHMEVYREVLQYFNQPTMECHNAIEKHRAASADPSTFILGEDFMGYGQCSPKMVIYDEKTKKRNRQIHKKYLTLQIS